MSFLLTLGDEKLIYFWTSGPFQTLANRWTRNVYIISTETQKHVFRVSQKKHVLLQSEANFSASDAANEVRTVLTNLVL